MKKTHIARPMNSVRTSIFDSAVDIIVPFHGHYDKVTRLVESIFAYTRSNYYNLFLVDDCSPNKEYIERVSRNLKKKRVGHVKTLRCKEQKGFAGACEVAYTRSEKPYVCFINSDCRIEDIGWLRSLGESLLNLKKDGVRLVVPRTNHPVNGDPRQKAEKGQKADDVILEDDFVSMYCFLCHRELFTRCDGFLKNYPYGFYEDEEFAYRMRKKGFKQAICGRSWVWHEGAATVRSIWRRDPNIRTIMEKENRERCIADMKALG